MHLFNVIKTIACRVGMEIGEHPILAAAREGQYDIVDHLLRCGIDPNIETARSSNAMKTTPLIEAARGDHLNVVELLVRHGADVNKISDGQSLGGDVTPLMAAVSPHRKGGKLYPPEVGVAMALLIAGANPNLSGKGDRNTILRTATETGEKALISMLREFGANDSGVPEDEYYGSLHNTYLKSRVSGEVWLDMVWRLQNSIDGDWNAESVYRCRQRIELYRKSDGYISTDSSKILGGGWVTLSDIKQLLDEGIIIWPGYLPLLNENSIYKAVILHQQYPRGCPCPEIHSIRNLIKQDKVSRT